VQVDEVSALTRKQKDLRRGITWQSRREGGERQRLAELLGVSPIYLCRVEQGNLPPTVDRMTCTAKLLCENPDELVAVPAVFPRSC